MIGSISPRPMAIAVGWAASSDREAIRRGKSCTNHHFYLSLTPFQSNPTYLCSVKRIDRLLLTSFVGPVVVTFFIALFVLIMQTLWVYIDDIIGKGAGFGMIVEFIFYRSISLFPMALPIAILLSSVMIMGNLAERYELASMKSAGVPLLRIMFPLIIASAGIGVFSWICSSYLIPVANLKFKSRLYDMRKQKPTLNLEEGVFNDDFEGYRIRIGEKGVDNKVIKNVFIANHSTSSRNDLNEIIAEDGEMYMTADDRYMIMELNEGQQFQEGNKYLAGSSTKAPFVRTSFKKYTKIFDLEEFEIDRTDEELFRSHYSMLSIRQLQEAIDSIDLQMDKRKSSISEYVNNFMTVYQDSTEKIKNDSLLSEVVKDTSIVAVKQQQVAKRLRNKSPKRYTVSDKKKQVITKELKEYDTFLETFPALRQRMMIDKAVQNVRSVKSNANAAALFMDRTKEKRVKHIFELHSKYAFAVVCIVFLFIGAPMGSIVRKGGFGYPLLVAIFCFMLYIVLTMAFKDMAEAFVLHPILAVWMPNLILLPIGIFLTYKAMNDSKFNFDRIMRVYNFIKNLDPRTRV